MVCYVNNNSFLTENAFDGMRKHLAQDFDLIYVLDLGGNVRKNPKLSGTTHNVFGIQVGVSINVFIRLPGAKKMRSGKPQSTIMRCRSEWRRETERYAFSTRRSRSPG